jgi:hypothetical protein
MDQSIKAGVFGFALAIIINLFSPAYLDFIPSFLAAILAIYIFRLGTFKEGLLVAFMTYIFNEGILGTIGLATLYFANEPYPSFNVDLWIMFSRIVSAVTAVIAGYIGVWFVQKMKRAQESSPPVEPQLSPI